VILKKKRKGRNGVLDAILNAHLSPLSLLQKILDPNNPEFADQRDIIYSDKST
jgi:hypothetical protein